jgi:D-amino-acid dehydrogenase
MPQHVAIIGAGIIGLSTAMELQQAGFRVTIIDPKDPGGTHAASFGNAGWLSVQSIFPPACPGVWKKIPGYLRDPLGPLSIKPSHLLRVTPWLLRYLYTGATWKRVEKTAFEINSLIAGSPALHKQQANRVGAGHLIKQDGVMIAYKARQQFEAEKGLWDIRAKAGITWQALQGTELRDKEPSLPDQYSFGVTIDGAGRCSDPGQYLAALSTFLRESGVEFLSASAVDFAFEGKQLTHIITDKGKLACDRAVISAGIWSKALGRKLGDNLPLESERGYHVRFLEAKLNLNHAYMASGASMIVHQMESGFRGAGQVEIASVETPPDWRRGEILATHMRGLYPNVELGPYEFWMGQRPSTPDGKPIIDFGPRSRDIVYACGHGHIGLMSSVRTARIVRSLLIGTAPEISIAPFALRRT